MFCYNIFSISMFVILFLNLGCYFTLINSYVVPTPTFELLKPQGIRISIADEPGVQVFAFQGNVNKKIVLNQPGEISGETYKQRNGKWIIEIPNKRLLTEDVIHYWIYVQFESTIYKKGEQIWTVTSESQRVQSIGKPEASTASPRLLFDENFDSLDNSVWSRIVKIPLNPDYEFNVYNNEQHTFSPKIANGIIHIKPYILEEHYGENVTAYGTLELSGCTSNIQEECSRKALTFNILPPILSIRLTTRNSFYFRYGKIEIRAKFPEGDWLYPEMWLEPMYYSYGPEYESGRIILGLARGNDNLVNVTVGDIYDSRRLDYGVRVGTASDVQNYMVSKIQESGPRWTKDFHIYTTIWSAEGFQFLVDGEEIGLLNPETNGWAHGNNHKMAPFDQEFCITIGVGVGGIRVFPGETTSSGHPKPWKNTDPKAMLKFWQARKEWLSSWKRDKGEKTAFEIDYIRVWSL